MHRVAWLVIPLLLAGCGGGKKAGTLSVVCTGEIQLLGATSIDVPGDVVNGRPILSYPDPANPEKTGTIAVEPRGNCRITPQPPG
jgi:hypothetical protein